MGADGVQKKEAGFIPALEGLRGVAIVIVLISHCYPPFSHFSWTMGMMGVTIFFVLSGYLITGILLHMQKGTRPNTEHMILFFANRTVRLAPALLLCAITTIFLWINQGRSFEVLKPHIITTLLYMENLFCKEEFHKDQVFAHAWTLAVEEQFYIFWAFMILLIRPLRPFMRATLILFLIGLSVIYRLRMFAIKDMDLMSKSLSANAYALLAGSALQLCWQPLPKWTSHRWAGYTGQIMFVGVVMALRVDSIVYSGAIWGPFITTIATMLVVLASAGEGNFVLEHNILRYMGRTSYSCYLWHHVLLWLTGLFNQVTIPAMGVVCLSMAIAHYSTIYFEEPIRELYKETSWFKEQKQKLSASKKLLPS
jgi:peptidoglycan/LPS O-acetylase OafA/YrhL